MDPQQDEDQSPLHIKRELDINIPYRMQFSQQDSLTRETPKTAIRDLQDPTISEMEDTDNVQSTPKTQIDVSSPRMPFLTHSQILGITNDDEDLMYSRSNINNPLQEVEEQSEEQTPVETPHKEVNLKQKAKDSLPSQDFILDNLSIVNSQQLRFSKKSSSDRDSMISKLEMENSKLREELRERIQQQEIRLKELDAENMKIKKRFNQEKVRYLEQQMESEYRVTDITEQFAEKEEQLNKTINQLKNELNASKGQINLLIKQQQSQNQLQEFKSDNFNKEQIQTKLICMINQFDSKFEPTNKDINELLSLLQTKIRILIQENEEEKMDEHREIISTLKSELSSIKQLRGQLSKIYGDYDQWMVKKNPEPLEYKINELNLQILGIKQEKLDLVEQNQKFQNLLIQKEQQIADLSSKVNNLSTDTLRKSSFLKSIQSNNLMDLKIIKETLKQKQEGLKKNLKSQNSPQSRSHNPSPTLKFLHSPKHSQQSPAIYENKSQFYKTSDFAMETQSHHLSNSSSLQSDVLQKLVEQFKGNSSFAQKMHNYSKRQ